MRKSLLVASIFFSILLFTSGCSDLQASVNTPSPPSIDAGTYDALETAMGRASDVPQKDSTPLVEQHQEPREGIPRAILLSPKTCHGRTLNTPPLQGGETQEHVRIWHLCYRPPVSNGASQRRPQRFRFEVITSEGSRTLLITPAPNDAAPWTISFLVVLPSSMVPALQGYTLYSDKTELGIAAPDDEGSFPSIQGELAVWRAIHDGTQVPEPPDHLCRRPRIANEYEAFFLPMDQCPGLERTCPLLERVDCRRF